MSTALAFTSDSLLCERSFSGKRWLLHPTDSHLAAALAREQQISPLLARILTARGVTPETAEEYLRPSLKASLPDPCHLLDMDIAAERVAAAIIGGEKIAIFGDYDVDGATSTALLLRYFRALGRDAIPYIPDRMKEGYGPNAPALLKLKDQGASLIITVDCGTLSFAPIEEASNAGLDIVVIDHHQGEARRPKALAIVNPNRLDETSPCRQLAAVGVAFLLIVAVSRILRKDGFFARHPEPDLKSLLDIVALGTICDMVPLTGVNRAFVTQGLKVMAARGNLGIRTLLDVARVDTAPTPYHAGFILGPRVNAGGRVGSSEYGTRLLATEDAAEALFLARELDRFNEERKAIEAMMLEDALAQAEMRQADDLIILHGDSWHPGVIGIIAGRIKERYGKPAAAVAFMDGVGKASARSVNGFDFGAAVIAACNEGLLVQGGGHAMAAGFTVEQAQLEPLRDFLTQRLQRVRHVLAEAQQMFIDGCISVGGATPELAKELELAGPYGSGNPQPKIMVQRAKLVQVMPVGADHLRLILIDATGLPGRLTAMAFRAATTPLGQALQRVQGRTLNIAGTLKADSWMGKTTACLHVDDAAECI